MKIVKFAASYLRQYRKLIFMLVVFAIVFAVVLSLYDLETEAVLYASLLCAAIGFVMIAVDCIFLYSKHRRLKDLYGATYIDPRDLPVPSKIIERDYSKLIEILLAKMQMLSNEHNSNRADMEEYYTTWAHQIKSPVSAMRLILQSGDSFQSSELLLELFKIEQYIEMVLSYIRLDSRVSDFVIRRCPLNKLVRLAVHKYAPIFIHKKLAIDIGDINGDVLTDEKWLSFVIEQILSNALKYTVSGKISIYAECNNLVIEDSGIGISAEDLPRIGEKGFTGINGRTDKKATGIGLFLCKAICKKLGHSLDIKSNVGVGTKVVIGLHSVSIIAE